MERQQTWRLATFAALAIVVVGVAGLWVGLRSSRHESSYGVASFGAIAGDSSSGLSAVRYREGPDQTLTADIGAITNNEFRPFASQPVGARSIEDLVAARGRLIAVGSPASVWSRRDGRWTRSQAPHDGSQLALMTTIASGPAGFIAGGREVDHGRSWILTATSTDGERWSWSRRSGNGEPHVAALDGSFVVRADETNWTSRDGIHWAVRTDAVPVGTGPTTFGAMAFGPNGGLQLGVLHYTQSVVWTSRDGSTWQRTPIALDLTGVHLSAVVPVSHGWLAGGVRITPDGEFPIAWTSTDTKHWVRVRLPAGAPAHAGISDLVRIGQRVFGTWDSTRSGTTGLFDLPVA